MAGDWQRFSIGDLCRLNVAKIQTGPFGSQLHAHDYAAEGVPVVPTEAIRNRRIDHSALPRISQEKADALSRHRLAEGDILFARRGAQATGHVAFVGHSESGFICGTGAIRLRLDDRQQLVRPDFLSHVIASPVSLAWFKHHAIGATMPNLNEGIIQSFYVDLPPLKEQSRIADSLGAIDDRIELNCRLMETLEAVARALFKSWFVDFDPVHARAEGLSTGLTDAIAALFPDSFGDDGLPTGWGISTVGSLYGVSGGNTPPTGTPEYWGGPHRWASPKDLSALASPVLNRTARQLTDAGLALSASGLLPVGSLLLSSRAPIGYTAFVTAPTAINQGFAGITRRSASTSYAWAWCREHMDVIRANAGGSTFPEISKSVFRGLPMLEPSEPVLGAFACIADSLINRIIGAVQEKDTLVALRDTLLPKLISGELRIADAERQIVAA